MTKVVHCKKASYDIYIGRPGIWGNPFLIGRDGDREKVIDKFERLIRKQPAFIERIKKELKGKTLGCWCSPKPCHGDVLVQIAEEE